MSPEKFRFWRLGHFDTKAQNYEMIKSSKEIKINAYATLYTSTKAYRYMYVYDRIHGLTCTENHQQSLITIIFASAHQYMYSS